MKASELRDMSESELLAKVEETRRESFGLRMRHATGELENTAGIRTAKRELARVLTEARARGIGSHPTSSRTDG